MSTAPTADVRPRAPRERRAMPHAWLFAFALAALPAASLALPGCGSEGNDGPRKDASTTDGDGADTLAPALHGKDPGLRRENPLPPPALEITDDDVPEPLVGESRLSPDALEIVPDEILPPQLNISADARQEILELLRAMQPLDPSLTSDHHDRWYILNRRRIEALEREERVDVGWAALHAFCNYPRRDFLIKNRLLRIGARVAPDEAKELLKTLVFTYGFPIEDRTSALEFLPEVDPEAVLEGARPYLERQGRPFQSAPADEFFVKAWNEACARTGTDPVPMLATVATNFALEPAARYLAVKMLRDHTDVPLARRTLEEVLVESTGDAIIRRDAAQSILAGYSREDACKLLEAVRAREQDINFARFLDDMVQTNCR